MPNYQDAKIYNLVGNGKKYIDSTTQDLYHRRTVHINDFKRCKPCMSSEIVSDPNYYMELIEYFPCSTKKELRNRERYYIEQIDCINKKIPYKTAAEHYESNKYRIKAYYEKIKAKIRYAERKRLARAESEQSAE
jgi:hypothetical protein